MICSNCGLHHDQTRCPECGRGDRHPGRGMAWTVLFLMFTPCAAMGACALSYEHREGYGLDVSGPPFFLGLSAVGVLLAMVLIVWFWRMK